MVTNGRVLARNSVLNVVGQVAPLAVAVFAVPILVRTLGVDRFGILTLAWAAIGYFGLFDLGLGRALTQAASAAIGAGRTHELPILSITALWGMAVLGAIGALLFAATAPLIVRHVLRIPISLSDETLRAFYVLCISLPFVLAAAGFRGLFEAHQHFGLVTALRIPYALFNFLAPLAVLPFSHSLVPIVAVLVVGRIASCLAHWVVARRRYVFLRTRVSVHRGIVLPLLKTGGWMTVSNIISPFMQTFDRFLIGALLSVTAVAYYATPYDMVMKLLIVPSALLGVLFPAFAATFERNRNATADLLDRTVRLMLIVIFPPVLLLVAFAHEGMQLWLGPEFARNSAPVVRWLAAGVLINSVGQVAFAAVQGVGRADITAKLHAIELPIYAAVLTALTLSLGLRGVAIAWTFRVTFDTVALLWLSARRLPEARSHLQRSTLAFGFLLAVLAVAGSIESLGMRIAVSIVVLGSFAVLGWIQLLRHDERQALLALIPTSS